MYMIRDATNCYIKDVVANAPATHNIPLVQIESKTTFINDEIECNLGERLKETFGVTISGVDGTLLAYWQRYCKLSAVLKIG